MFLMRQCTEGLINLSNMAQLCCACIVQFCFIHVHELHHQNFSSRVSMVSAAVTGVIVLTSFVCLCVSTLAGERTDKQT